MSQIGGRAVSNREVWPVIARLLGIEDVERVTRMQLVLEVNSVPTVEITVMPEFDREMLDAPETVTQAYRLDPITLPTDDAIVDTLCDTRTN